jgi:DNA-binding transcriptional MocR family regulator
MATAASRGVETIGSAFTFSKTLSHALRTGFMVVPEPLTATICAVRQIDAAVREAVDQLAG